VLEPSGPSPVLVDVGDGVGLGVRLLLGDGVGLGVRLGCRVGL
jgi:hypothetical protein